MKTLAQLFAVLLAASAPAFAGPCVALEYQEMKDMSANDLAAEYCKASDALSANMDDVMSNLRAGDNPKPYPAAHDNFDQCQGQLSRIQRVLESKGVTKEQAIETCNRRSQGRAAGVPAPAK